jgi:medium-chain acyl-[acyl-carrier-protein] hydrolase
LICLPYAGGSASIYRAWPGGLDGDVELAAIQLPGRGPRLREAPFTQMVPLLEGLVEAITPLCDVPVALFGHSMGALVAFELARRLRDERRIGPTRLLLSGRRAPQIPGPGGAPLSNRSREQFLDELRRLGGTPEEIFAYPEVLELALPALRADFEVIETWHSPSGIPLSLPLVVFGGQDEFAGRVADLDAWQVHTTGPFALHLLPGDHFFLHSAQDQLVARVRAALADVP